jgi:formate hydrogenlyase transcriptional activator
MCCLTLADGIILHRRAVPFEAFRLVGGMTSSAAQTLPLLELRSFIDRVPALAWSALPDGSLDFFNQQFRDFTGLSPDQLYGSEWKSAVHRDDIQELEAWWRDLRQFEKGGTAEVRLRRFDGEFRWFQIAASPVHNEQSNLVRWYGIYTDIHDVKRSEHRTRQDEAYFRTITDTIRQVIVVLSPEGRTLYANRVALDQTGLTLDEVIDQGWYLLAFHPDDVDRLRAERQDGLLRGAPFELEIRARHKSGQYRWYLVQYNPLKDESGKIIRWYATATDIDDRKKIEERLRNENLVLREEIDRSSMFEEIVGSCKPIRQVLRQVEKVAPSDSTVLILGETGTGKELIARALHRRSKRANRAFIRVNCAAIPQSLIASELFGHEKGAFTGALQRRPGRFEAADGGTLFLDEIGDLPMETQIALLRVLQEKEFERVGSNHPISVDVRLIAATNRDLPTAVADGTFRQDLFYRLNVFPIIVPPLRERVDDIPLLVEYFVGRFAKGAGKNIRHIEKHTLEQLKGYGWPGNIRELQNVVERAVILCETDTFDVDESWLRSEPARSPRSQDGLSALEDREVQMIEEALAETHGRISGPSGAAAKLGIPRQTLESKIRRFGIDRYGQKRSAP